MLSYPHRCDADILPVSLGKRTKHTPPCPSQTTARNVWQVKKNAESWPEMLPSHFLTLKKDGETRHKCTKKVCQSWLQRRDLWIVYKLFPSWDWSVRGDGVDRLSLPYSVLWKNLMFCCCCRSRFPEEGAQAQQNLFHSCLAVQKGWTGKRQESKRDWRDITILQTRVLAKMKRGNEELVKIFVVSLPFLSHKSYCKQHEV